MNVSEKIYALIYHVQELIRKHVKSYKKFISRIFHKIIYRDRHNQDFIENREADFHDFKEKISTKHEFEFTEVKKFVSNKKVFVVHGHDGEIKTEVAQFFKRWEFDVIILNEQPNHGKTIIEKLEASSDVDLAVILMTGDDLGRLKSDEIDQPRARQNVIFEAGYFMGRLGRNKVILIYENGLDIPSDLHGIAYTNKENWQLDMSKELSSMGYDIDINKLS